MKLNLKNILLNLLHLLLVFFFSVKKIFFNINYRIFFLIFDFLGKGEAVEPMLESLKIISEPLRSFATVLVECCAYAGTGNVLKIQHMLHICSEHFENKDEKKVRFFFFFFLLN